jgi:hypothetical protein
MKALSLLAIKKERDKNLIFIRRFLSRPARMTELKAA